MDMACLQCPTLPDWLHHSTNKAHYLCQQAKDQNICRDRCRKRPLRCHDELQSSLEEIRLRFGLVNRKYPDISEEFQATIGGKFASSLLLDEDLEAITNNLNKIMSETSNRVLEENQRKSKPWATDKILKLCDIKRNLKKEKNNIEGRSEYRKINKEFRREMKEAKQRRIVE